LQNLSFFLFSYSVIRIIEDQHDYGRMKNKNRIPAFAGMARRF
jgi:hypothetical protein